MAGKQRNPLKKQAFMKFLVGDFSQDLRIPPPFVKRFIGQRLYKCALRDPSGKSWVVKLEKRGNDVFFRKGWPKFVKDHFLEYKDVLIFRYDGASKFDVTIYDKTCCEKDVEEAKRRGGSSSDAGRRSGSSSDAGRTSDEDLMSEEDVVEYRRSSDSIVFTSDKTCFMKTLSQHTLYQIQIPKALARAQGLTGKETLTLVASGKSWKVEVYLSAENRFLMTKGWSSVHRANQIEEGDTIGFEFVKPTLVQVHFSKKR